jgi:PAS domain S-box-containing protein
MVTLAEDQPVPTPYFATNLTKEGNSIDIRADWNYKRDEKGRVAGFISVITDITEQKQAEEDLKKTRDHLYNIIESSLDSIVVADTKGHITRANISFCELAGYSKEEILGKCITELAPTKAGSYESSTGGMVKVNEKFIDNAKTTMQRLREGKKIYNWESYVLRKDKLLVPTEDTIVALHGEDGGKQEFLAIIRDITERKKSEQDLSESEEKYYKLMETANDAIFIAEAETGIITDANKKAEELLGVPIEEIIGMHQTHLFSKEDRDYYSKVFSDHIKIGKGVIDNTDIFVSNKNGSKIPVEVSYSVTEIAGKKIVQGIFRNITTRRKAEAEIRKSEEKYHKLMETANDAIFIAETETGIITDANKKAEELLGVPVKEIIGMHQDQFHAKEDRDYYRKLFADQAQIDKGFITGGLYVSHKNGHKVPIEISTSVTKIEGRTIMQGIFRDITERVNAEREIKEARYFFENIINTSLDGILITDSSGITTIVNPAFERMLDCSKDDLIGKHPSAFIPKGKEYEEEGREFIKQLIEKGTVLGRERILSRKDGTVLYVEQNAVFLKDAQGNLMGAAGSFRDITERKKAQEEIINHQNKLKSLTSQLTLVEEKERRRFADYLHDQIGQKLFISKLKLEVLKKSISSADQNKALGEIHEIILQMIKDTRSLTFDLSPPVLYQLGLGAALEWLTDQASAQYGIMVTFENDEEEKALADDTKVLIFQAVRELISNIAKHAQTDKAKISMQRDNVNIRICVEDDGVGFTPSNRTSPSSSTGGFGLFSIEERIDHLGGQFKIESKPGHGTKAVILAPLSD